MELRHLAYFVAVAEEGNFTRAADRALVAQPAISQQILRLERELGEKLFHRTAGGVRLTEAGAVLLPHARAVLAGADRARDALTSLRGLTTGRLALGSVQSPPVLARLLGRFRELHPGIELSVREAHTEPLVHALRGGELDVALIGLGRRQKTPDTLQALVIATEPVAVVVHRDHPLARRTSVTLAQLRDQPWVTMPEGSGQRTMLDDAARAAGFAPQITVESSDMDLLVALAAQRVGIALIRESAARQSPDVATVPITRPRLERRIALAWREDDLSHAARAFVALAQEASRP
jgi:DNA-binding transcriptional LysR family regulator